MAQPQGGEHISKGITENQYLPPLQKQILLYLAENLPQSRYSASRGIKGYYKSVYTAFDDLLGKKIIVLIKEEEYRNRKHSMFWLTPAGYSLHLLKEQTRKYSLTEQLRLYPDNKMLQCIVELTTVLGTDMHRIGYQAILRKGKLEKSDVSLMLGTALLKELSLEQITEIIALMKKYPEQYRANE